MNPVNQALYPQIPFIQRAGPRTAQVAPKPIKVTILNPSVKPVGHPGLYLAVALVVSCVLGILIYAKIYMKSKISSNQITKETLESWKFHFTCEAMKMQHKVHIDPSDIGLNALVSKLKSLRGKEVGDVIVVDGMPYRLIGIHAPAFNHTFTDFPLELEALVKT